MPPEFRAPFTIIFVALMVLTVVAHWRFYSAYRRIYWTDQDRRRRWNFRDWIDPPDPWNISALFRSVDDPLVERRRVQVLLAWGATFAFFILAPIAYTLSGAWRTP